MGKIRGTHSSPGIYTKFTDISYASKSLGITTLGLVGETLKGPAFEPIPISSWTEYVQYFGGTSADKFYGSQYPKYELPYIAKEYLSVSDQMYVCRVLGLSGYDAGPTFIITAHKEENNDHSDVVVAVLRSRGTYRTYPKNSDECNTQTDYDTLKFYVNYIKLSPYKQTSTTLSGCDTATGNNTLITTGDTTSYPTWYENTLTETGQSIYSGITVDSYNYGKFNISGWYLESETDEPTEDNAVFSEVGVSLNPNDSDYIYKVLGGSPEDSDGSQYIYVEELYDMMLENGIISDKTIKFINMKPTIVSSIDMTPVCDPVADFVTIPYGSLKRKNIGQTYLCKTSGTIGTTGETGNGFVYFEYDNNGLIDTGNTLPMEVGHIYTVVSAGSDAKYKYCYVELKDSADSAITVGSIDTTSKDWITRKVEAVKVLKYDRYYYMRSSEIVDQMYDISDYKEEFRCATTPWTVSEIKGNGGNFSVYRLFRFHTISDGASSNSLFKISIANIDPDEGTFDVYVRDFEDTDTSPYYLETFKGVSMSKDSGNYIGLKIGTIDGEYESKSKYVLVEINDNETTEQCVPCGFLGYPVRNYGENIEAPSFKYNLELDEDIANKKQFFGLSDLTGVDLDMLTYKGKNAYTERYAEGYTHPFHLDSRLNKEVFEALVSASGSDAVVIIDNDKTTSGITWDAVSPSNLTEEGISPVIGTSDEMEGTIYETKVCRKFTFYPYGGFDGWDPYRTSRTNSDEFKANKYKGTVINGYGKTFSTITNPESLALSGKCITSDYYAYLAGINQFENPEKCLINLFATPGIDYVNNKLLCDDAITMIEELRGDSLYVITTPDKPFGASESVDEMYTSEDAVMNLEDSEIDTYYTATYYPWVKYYDSDNKRYLSLPVTKDVLRNMADVDNKKYPWYAPAGIERGNVNCTKARIFSKLEEEDTLYDGRINPVKTFSKDGVKVWGNKTMYTGDTPMNRINVVRLMLYMRKLIIESCRSLIFEPNDTTLKSEFESIVKPILEQIQKDRGITAFRLDVSQTTEEMDAHELSCTLWVKPTPALEYIEINFMVTPQGVDFDTV